MAGSSVGRPSVARERRAQIIDAFIELIARHGLEHVGLDDIAQAAGMKRPAVRHFVGNRDDLVAAAMQELCRRYEVTVRELTGGQPGVEALIDALFSDEWVTGHTTDDLAFDALLAGTAHDARNRTEARGAYDILIGEIEAAIRRDRPTAEAPEVTDTAYAIVCLVEHNTTMQRLGYPPERSSGARDAAIRLTRSLGAR